MFRALSVPHPGYPEILFQFVFNFRSPRLSFSESARQREAVDAPTWHPRTMTVSLQTKLYRVPFLDNET